MWMRRRHHTLRDLFAGRPVEGLAGDLVDQLAGAVDRANADQAAHETDRLLDFLTLVEIEVDEAGQQHDHDRT